MKRKNLGRGLDALIPETAAPKPSGYETLRVDLVRPGESQPRRAFEERPLRELADSIRENGVVQPIIVRRKNGGFEIVAGERRWRAARMAGLERIPAIIREATDLDAAELTLVENIQREDLNPLEEAAAYETLSSRFSLTHEEISKKTGKARSAISNQLRLLNLSENAKDALVSGKITAGHARALLAAGSRREMDSLLAEVMERDLTVRKTESLAKKRAERRKPQTGTLPREAGQDIFSEDLGERIAERFSTRVRISRGRSKGKIEIEFYSPGEFDRIVGMLLSGG